VLTALSDLEQLTDDFPEDFFKMKVLPELLKSVEFGGGGPKAFGLVMKIATKISDEDFDAKVTPVLIRLFGNPDRAIRVCLLDNLPLMINRLSQKVVNDKIFPQIVGCVSYFTFVSLMLMYLGYRVHGPCSGCTGTNVEVGPHPNHKALGSNYQRRLAQIPRKDGQ
jgi:hypothetical protein